MGSDVSREALPIPPDFGPADGDVDRSRLHDVPWMETLKQMGATLFAVDQVKLDSFLMDASDAELYACRALFRGYRAYVRQAEAGDQKDFATGLYFVVAQQPTELLQFYVMLHICWTFGMELALDPQTLGAEFVLSLARTYFEEKGPRPEYVHDEEAKVKQRLVPVFVSIITQYLLKVLDAVSNPDYQDPVVEPFGTLEPEQQVHVWTLKASDGSIEVRVTDYGAAIVGCRVRDKEGAWVETVRSPSSVEGLVQDKALWRGATIGRYANRISKSSIVCNQGKTYKLDANERSNHLHGGDQGWGRRVWTAAENAEHSSASTMAFTLVSKDGDMGYPGLLAARVEYSVRPQGIMVMRYNAQLFAPSGETVECPINMTNHAYWWLGGPCESVEEHELALRCDKFVECTDELLPTGVLVPVEGSHNDFFTRSAKLGTHIYDLCFCAKDFERGKLKPIATLYSAASGIQMDVSTTEPGVQVYSGSKTGVCLECGAFPDTPNHPEFPSCIVSSAGPQYAQLTIHQFSVRESNRSTNTQ